MVVAFQVINQCLEEEVAVVMDHVGNLCDSFARYFKALEYMGHYDKSETQNLLIYTFLVNEILDGPLGKYLDDEGLIEIEKVLRCLYKGCLINPVRDNIRIKEPDPYYIGGILRYSEDSNPRYSEDDATRITE